MQNANTKTVKISVTISITLKNFNLVVAAFGNEEENQHFSENACHRGNDIGAYKEVFLWQKHRQK